ncbi:MAG: Stealth CR1 domain-containing protein [Lachnospiraceae bacterium]|nr:Stealth CR1 domain-containing protein [Lachnospiraceae bacterium]
MEEPVIDAVILWVDGNDPEWIKERNKYQPDMEQEGGKSRYRDWGILKYLLRSICKYASWIHTVHLVTCGQKPEWINLECEKLHLVKHADFIPPKYLPTFSSRSIDLNLHRIDGLAEHFIYFNDDMLLTNYVKPSDFFVNGLPCDMFSERPICYSGNVFAHNLLNDIEALSQCYDRKNVLKKNRNKILNIKYGKFFFYNLIWYFFPYKKFSGLYICHLPLSYRKSTWEKLWRLFPKQMEETISNKFRTITDLNQFIFVFDALLSGDFYPTNMDKQGRYFNIVDDSNIHIICDSIIQNKYKRICINDNCGQEVYEKGKSEIVEALNIILPEKCIFER